MNDTDMSAPLDDLDMSEEDAILNSLDKLTQDAPKEPVAEDEPKGPTNSEPETPAEPDYNPQELLAIFDTILFEGEYREVVKIGKRFSVTLRTRTVGEANEITRRVDNMDLKTYMAVQNFSNVATLAYAVVDINGKNVTDLKLDKRYEMIRKLPEPVIIRLSQKLFKFDQKIYAAMEEGDKNF